MTFRLANGGNGAIHYGSGNPNVNVLVQGAGNGASSGSVTVTTSGSVTAGNLLVVLVQTESTFSNASSLTLTDNLSPGTTYHYIAQSTGNSGVNAAIYYGVPTGSGTCTISGNPGTTYSRTTVAEFTKCGTTIDNSNAVFATSTVSVTANHTNDLIVGAGCSFASATVFTAGTGFAIAAQANGADAGFIEYAAPTTQYPFGTTTGTQNVTVTSIDAHSPFFAVTFTPPTVNSVGNDGDFFMDTTNRKLYGPRTGGVYPYAGSFPA